MRAVRTWLAVVALLVAAMVIVGGATRLTESGLSIVEWKPVTGTLPPLSAEAWDAAFAAYKTIPQYREVNAGMSLAEFKTIFWWEWGHRLLGRVIGFAFLLPFLFFLWRGGLGASLKRRLWAIFGLGALQGVAGWWMVVSGLTHRVDVSQYRLAVHLMLAIFIFAAIVWTIRQLTPRATLPAPPRARRGAQIVLWVTFIQIYLGALVAGLRAGKAYNTWPLIDGAFIPDAGRLFFETPWWRNFFDSVLTVQFSHRMGAYLLLTLAILYMIDTLRRRGDGRGSRDAVIIVLCVLLQAGLGIWTLVLEVPIGPALLHQAGALVVLTAVLVHYERLRPREAAEGVAVPAAILKPTT